MNAHRINHGEYPDICNNAGSDFFMLYKDTPEAAAPAIVDLVSRRLPGYFHVSPEAIQVLSPMQRGEAGAANLNLLLQEKLNAANADHALRRSGITYRLGDRVMQIRNNYDKDVYNGDIGLVSSVNMEERTLSVLFDDRTISYDITELDEIVLAYATTIHKAQGAEFPVVVMPVLNSHFVMLQRNLIYTGITRAKRAVVLVGSKGALSYAIRNDKVGLRNSRLSARLSANA